jgi:hypothetical protein
MRSWVPLALRLFTVPAGWRYGWDPRRFGGGKSIRARASCGEWRRNSGLRAASRNPFTELMTPSSSTSKRSRSGRAGLACADTRHTDRRPATGGLVFPGKRRAVSRQTFESRVNFETRQQVMSAGGARQARRGPSLCMHQPCRHGLTDMGTRPRFLDVAISFRSAKGMNRWPVFNFLFSRLGMQ